MLVVKADVTSVKPYHQVTCRQEKSSREGGNLASLQSHCERTVITLAFTTAETGSTVILSITIDDVVPRTMIWS